MKIIRRFFSIVLLILIIPVFAIMAALVTIAAFALALFVGLSCLACFLWFGSLEDTINEIVEAKTKVKKEGK